MTAQAKNQAKEPKQNQIAQNAALIANFYGKRGQLQQLQDCLVQGLNLSLDGQKSGYTNQVHNAFLFSFDPLAISAEDTSIIQLALNMSGPVERAWKDMRQQLEEVILDDSMLSAVWGYTLIYQAELVEESHTVSVQEKLLPVAQRLYPHTAEYPQKLAETKMPGGWIGLSDIPLQGDGLQAATVYIALSLPNTNNQLVQDVLYNPAAGLLMADLIAHKGYHQIRQYRLGGLIDRYQQRLDTLLKQVEDSLQNPTVLSKTTAKLEDLSRGHNSLVIASAYLNTLRVSLMRQTSNIIWWCKQADGGDIVKFHQHYLEDSSQELALLLDEGQRPLEATKLMVDVIKSSLDQEQERKQQRIETLLGTAAAVLSVLVLLDKEAARGLLDLVGVPPPIGILPVLGVQVVCMVVVALLAVFVIRLIRAKYLRFL